MRVSNGIKFSLVLVACPTRFSVYLCCANVSQEFNADWRVLSGSKKHFLVKCIELAFTSLSIAYFMLINGAFLVDQD